MISLFFNLSDFHVNQFLHFLLLVPLSPNSTAEKLEKLKKIPSLFDIETFAPGEGPKDRQIQGFVENSGEDKQSSELQQRYVCKTIAWT